MRKLKLLKTVWKQFEEHSYKTPKTTLLNLKFLLMLMAVLQFFPLRDYTTLSSITKVGPGPGCCQVSVFLDIRAMKDLLGQLRTHLRSKAVVECNQ